MASCLNCLVSKVTLAAKRVNTTVRTGPDRREAPRNVSDNGAVGAATRIDAGSCPVIDACESG